MTLRKEIKGGMMAKVCITCKNNKSCNGDNVKIEDVGLYKCWVEIKEE